MVDYTFTTTQGWRVTEYRPFSLSYAVTHTPGLHAYTHDEATPYAGAHPRTRGTTSLLSKLTNQKVEFDGRSLAVLKQLVQERVALRDRNRHDILGTISDLTGYIGICYHARNPENMSRRPQLERTKLDLERQLREEDLNLWRDLTEIRRDLILAGKQYEATQLRAELIPSGSLHDDNQRQGDAERPGEVPGIEAHSWRPDR